MGVNSLVRSSNLTGVIEITDRKNDPKGPRKKAIDERKIEIDQKRTIDFPHKHCNNCGLSVRPEAEYCSDECQHKFEKMIKRKKQLMYLPYIGIVLILLFYLLVYARL